MKPWSYLLSIGICDSFFHPLLGPEPLYYILFIPWFRDLNISWKLLISEKHLFTHNNQTPINS